MEVAMNGLSRESQALLAAARHRDGLSAADKDRVRNKITRRLGAGLALGSAVTASATVAEAAHTTVVATVAAWLPGAAKVLSVVAIAGGVTVGAVRVSQHGAQKAAVAMSAPPSNSMGSAVLSKQNMAREMPQAVSTSQTESPDQVSEPAASPASGRELPALRRESRVSNTSALTNEPAPLPVAKPTDDGLSSQIAAIREARAALRRGDGRTAIAALDRGLPLGQGGPLEQEAIVARVSALCLLGDVSTARRTAEQFLTRFPDSLLAPRIRNSCAYGARNTP
jgi:hypothetical protein